MLGRAYWLLFILFSVACNAFAAFSIEPNETITSTTQQRAALLKTNMDMSSSLRQKRRNIMETLSRQPVEFTPFDDDGIETLGFYHQGYGYNVSATSQTIELQFYDPFSTDFKRNELKKLSLKFAGSNRNHPILEENIQDITLLRIFNREDKQALRYEDLYEGIDLVLHGKGENIQYDFIIKPDANVRDIAIKNTGVKSLALNDDGELVLRMKEGKIIHSRPFAYQLTDQGVVEVEVAFALRDKNMVSFNVGHYDKTLPLVIDPIIRYSSYVLGSIYDDYAVDIKIDNNNNLYILGTVYDIGQTTHSAWWLARFSPDGSALTGYYDDVWEGRLVEARDFAISGDGSKIYVVGIGIDESQPGCFELKPVISSFIQEISLPNDEPNGTLTREVIVGGECTHLDAISLINDNTLYVAGRTNKNPSLGEWDIASNPQLISKTPDAGNQLTSGVVAKYNATTLSNEWINVIAGEKVGLEYGVWAKDIIADGNGNSYVTGGIFHDSDIRIQGLGSSQSNNAPVLDPTSSFYFADAGMWKFSSNGTLVTASSWGGTDDEEGLAITLSTDDSLYHIAGKTGKITSGILNYDTFVRSYQNGRTGNLHEENILFGGHKDDIPHDIEVTYDNDIVITGITESATEGDPNNNTFPLKNNIQSTVNGIADAYLTILDKEGFYISSSLVYGGTGYESGKGIVVDRANNPWIVGDSKDGALPVYSEDPINKPILQSENTAKQDAFYTHFLLNDEMLAFDGEAVREGVDISTDVITLLDNDRLPVTGIASDGAAKVLLRIENLTNSDPVTFELFNADDDTQTDAGSLVDPLDTQIPLPSLIVTVTPVLTDEVNNTYTAFATLNAATDFVRSADDQSIGNRPIRIRATTTNAAYDRVLKLYRPPIALLHTDGLIGWGWDLVRNNAFITKTHHMEYPLNTSITTHTNKVNDAINSTLKKLRRLNVAVVSTDVFAHGVAGLMVRLYMQNGEHRREDNFDSFHGDIHKLVFLNTPHHGSLLIDYYSLIPEPALKEFFALRTPGLCNQCIGITELQTDGDVVAALNSDINHVAVHAIGGTGFQNVVSVLAGAGIRKVVETILKNSTKIVSMNVQKNIANVLNSNSDMEAKLGSYAITTAAKYSTEWQQFMDLMDGDMFSGIESQHGGLLGTHTTTYQAQLFVDSNGEPQFSPLEDDIDFNNPNNGLFHSLAFPGGLYHSVTLADTVNTKAIELLNARRSSSHFASLLPKASIAPSMLSMSSLSTQAVADESTIPRDLLIEGIVENQQVAGNTVLSLTITTIDGQPATDVMLFSPSIGHFHVEQTPAVVDVRIPATALGLRSFHAIGTDSLGNYIAAPDINIEVITSNILTGIDIETGAATSNSIDIVSNTPYQIQVIGKYDDGFERYITQHPDTGFEILDLTVATVDASGIITPIRDGETILYITNGAFSKRVMVTVTGVNAAPKLSPIGDQYAFLGETFFLNVSATDPEGALPSLELRSDIPGATFVDYGDGTGQFSWPVTSDNIGRHLVSFRANDPTNSNIYGSKLIHVTVREPLPEPPIASAGIDQTVTSEDTVTLDATASDPVSGTIASYQWTQINGPAVSLSDSTLAQPSFVAPTVTSDTLLEFSVEVTNSFGLSATDTVVITVQKKLFPPVANAGPDQEVREGDTVNLDGSASYDPDGVIFTYQWTVVGGVNVTLIDANTSTPSFVAPDVQGAGNQTTIELQVSDTDGLTATDTVVISILDYDYDSEPDGMPDLWEIDNFGHLNETGDGDFDLDGITNADEYLYGTDPKVYTPPVSSPQKVSIASTVGTNVVSWENVTGATSYNVYWSTNPNIDVATANSVVNATNPFAHTSLQNGTTYYYAVTALEGLRESDLSNEVNGIPWVRTWAPVPAYSPYSGDISTPQFITTEQGLNGIVYSLWWQYDGRRYQLAFSQFDPTTNQWSLVQSVTEAVDISIPVYLDIDDNGDGVALWGERTRKGATFISTASYTNGQWSNTSKLMDDDATINLDRTVFASSPGGNAVFAFVDDAGRNISSTTYIKGNNWSAIQPVDLSDFNGRLGALDVAINDTGKTIIAWSEQPTDLAASACRSGILSTIWGSIAYSPGVWQTPYWADYYDGVFGRHQYIDVLFSGGRNTYGCPNLDLHVQADGTALFLLDSASDFNPRNLHLQVHDETKGWEAYRRISDDSGFTSTTCHFSSPTIKLDPAGNAVVTANRVFQDENFVCNKSELYGLFLDKQHDISLASLSSWDTQLIEPAVDALDERFLLSVDNAGAFTLAWNQQVGADRKTFTKEFIPGIGWSARNDLLVDNVAGSLTMAADPVQRNILLSWFAWSGVTSIFSDGSNALPNQAPVADAGPDQLVNEGTVVTLDGSNSSDSDGSVQFYQWTQLSGPSVTLNSPSSVTTTFNAPRVTADNVLVFELTVTDNRGSSATDTVSITLQDLGEDTTPPVTTHTYQERSVKGAKVFDITLLVNETATTYFRFIGAGSITAGGSDTQDFQVYSTPVTVHLDKGGDGGIFDYYSVDTSNNTEDINSLSLPSGISGQAPTANAGIDQDVTALTLVTLDGSLSSDADGTIVSYSWAQLSGPTATLSGANAVTATFSAPDVTGDSVLTFELTVTDDSGLTASDTVDVIVRPLGGDTTPPVTTIDLTKTKVSGRNRYAIDFTVNEIADTYFRFIGNGIVMSGGTTTTDWQQYTGATINIHMNKGGTGTFEFYSIDSYGNQEQTQLENL